MPLELKCAQVKCADGASHVMLSVNHVHVLHLVIVDGTVFKIRKYFRE